MNAVRFTANSAANASIKVTARFAGLLYLALGALSLFGLTYVPSVILVAGDSAATAINIVASESLFRLGIVGNLFTFTVNIFLAVLLYKVFEPVNKTMAGTMVILILVGVGIAMLNELNQFAALLFLSGGDHLAAFTSEQLQALATLFLDIYEHGFVVAHIFFGLWLFPMGYLVIKSGFMPKVIGIFLIIAGVGYVIDFIIFFLFPEITVTVIEYTFVGEVLMLLWLLVMGVNVERWKAHASQTASI